jgi:hypothetical protein
VVTKVVEAAYNFSCIAKRIRPLYSAYINRNARPTARNQSKKNGDNTMSKYTENHDTPTNCDQIIDSRDVIARIEELEILRDSAQEEAEEHNAKLAELVAARNSAEADDVEAAEEELGDHGPEQEKISSDDGEREFFASEDYGTEEEEELFQLTRLQDQSEGYADDWNHGAQLISDDYFQKYAEQLADDLGYTGGGKTDSWPFTCIDWEQAAEELQQDYTQVDFDGSAYWIR